MEGNTISTDADEAPPTQESNGQSVDNQGRTTFTAYYAGHADDYTCLQFTTLHNTKFHIDKW